MKIQFIHYFFTLNTNQKINYSHFTYKMGIKGLSKFLKDKYPSLYKEKSVEKLKGMRLGIDVTGFFYKYMPVNRDKWFDSFVIMMMNFKKNDILPLFIFDGQPPIEKLKTKEKRRKNKVSLEQKLVSMSTLMDEYNINEQLSKELEEKMKVTLKIENSKDILEAMMQKIEQTEKQIINITYDDIILFTTLVDCFGYSYISPKYGESEAICSWLCKLGKLDGIISNDSDCLCYDTKMVVYNYSPFTKKCNIIKKKKLLKKLEMTQEQFTDFCILCGTDYNDNIKGVGPVMSFNLIKKYGSIEEIEKNKSEEKKLKDADMSILQKDSVRRLFSQNPTDPNHYILHRDINKEEKKLIKSSTLKATEEMSDELSVEEKRDMTGDTKEEDTTKDTNGDTTQDTNSDAKELDTSITEEFQAPNLKKPNLPLLWNTLSRKNTRIKYDTLNNLFHPVIESVSDNTPSQV